MDRFTEKFKDGRNILRKGISDVFHVGVGRFFEGEAIDRLAEYEGLEEKGRLLKLPCVVGDKVWFTKFKFSYMKNPKAEKIRKVEIIDGEIIFRTENRCFEMKCIGKTVFLTREEAEAALIGMEDKEE